MSNESRCCHLKHSVTYLLLGSIIVFVLMAACCGGDHWLQEADESNYGLWRECKQAIGAFMKTCVDRDAGLGDHALRSQRALTIISSAAAALASILGFLCRFTSYIKPPFVSLLLVTASITTGVAVGLFTYNKHEETTRDLSPSKFAWSWYLGWIGVGLGFITALFGICCGPIREKATINKKSTTTARRVDREVTFAEPPTTAHNDIAMETKEQPNLSEYV
eukprot:TCONS_00007610-protein